MSAKLLLAFGMAGKEAEAALTDGVRRETRLQDRRNGGH